MTLTEKDIERKLQDARKKDDPNTWRALARLLRKHDREDIAQGCDKSAEESENERYARILERLETKPR